MQGTATYHFLGGFLHADDCASGELEHTSGDNQLCSSRG